MHSTVTNLHVIAIVIPKTQNSATCLLPTHIDRTKVLSALIDTVHYYHVISIGGCTRRYRCSYHAQLFGILTIIDRWNTPPFWLSSWTRGHDSGFMLTIIDRWNTPSFWLSPWTRGHDSGFMLTIIDRWNTPSFWLSPWTRGHDSGFTVSGLTQRLTFDSSTHFLCTLTSLYWRPTLSFPVVDHEFTSKRRCVSHVDDGKLATVVTTSSRRQSKRRCVAPVDDGKHKTTVVTTSCTRTIWRCVSPVDDSKYTKKLCVVARPVPPCASTNRLMTW